MTGEDRVKELQLLGWEQTLHRQVFFFDDGTFEETRG